jgi:hypothetical protein
VKSVTPSDIGTYTDPLQTYNMSDPVRKKKFPVIVQDDGNAAPAVIGFLFT